MAPHGHHLTRGQVQQRAARKSSGSGIQHVPDTEIDTVGAYLVFESMGSGAFGEVFKAMHMVSGEMVAIKRLKLSKSGSKLPMREADALSKAGTHHHCLSVLEVRDTDEEVFLVTDFCKGGDLYDYCFPSELSQNEGSIWVLEEAEALDLFTQLLLALEHVHSCGYVHGDVKLENVFMHSPEHIVLGDFGLATPFTKGDKRKANLATTHYCSPEAYLDLPVEGPESDVWSLGIVLFIMLHGRYPFFGDSKTEVMQAICGSTPRFDSDISASVQHMIARMLTKHPRHRITIPEIKRLPIMRGVVAAVQRDCDLAANERWMPTSASKPVKISRVASGPVSKSDFSILARSTRVLDASIIPPKANPFLSGREGPVMSKTELKAPTEHSEPANPFLMALLEIQANFDNIVAESRTPPRLRASRCVSADDEPRSPLTAEQLKLPSLEPAARRKDAELFGIGRPASPHDMDRSPASSAVAS